MITIKFSHRYTKMPEYLSGTFLRDVEVTNLEDCEEEFLKKDTEIVGGGHYPLPKKGKYMILWLETGAGIRSIGWQTIRRWTPKKEEYYRSHVGELVNIEVIE